MLNRLEGGRKKSSYFDSGAPIHGFVAYLSLLVPGSSRVSKRHSRIACR